MENKQELKKHAAAIHCANTLSLLQRKISNALLFHAYHELSCQLEHEITVKQLCTTIGYRGNNHSAIKESLRGLLTTLVEWNVTENDKECEDWTASTMLASVRIKGSVCLYAYSPRMKELLYSPSMYGKINLFIQSKFQSSYGLALYENCIRYRELPSTKWFDMDIFRKLMGVPNDKYIIFRDFKKRVIDKSVQEVNEHSDLLVIPEMQRAGGKVTKIRFKLASRNKKNKIGDKVDIQNPILSKDKSELFNKLKGMCCLSHTQALKLIEDFSEEYLLEKIAVMTSSESFINGKIKNVAAYFLQAVKSDFKIAKSSSEIDTRKIEQGEAINQNVMREVSETNFKNEYNIYLKNEIEYVLSKLPSERYLQIKLEFQEFIEKTNKFVFEKYLKEGDSSEMVKASFRHYFKEKYGEYLAHLLSYNEFIVHELEYQKSNSIL